MINEKEKNPERGTKKKQEQKKEMKEMEENSNETKTNFITAAGADDGGDVAPDESRLCGY